MQWQSSGHTPCTSRQKLVPLKLVEIGPKSHPCQSGRSRCRLLNLELHRSRNTGVMSSSQRQEVKVAKVSKEMRHQPVWLLSPAHYMTICLAPNILAMLFSPQILQWPQWNIAFLMVGIDVIFTIGSFLFMERIVEVDKQWHGSSKDYPGPWRDLGAGGQICAPSGFFNYVKVYFLTGVVVPVGFQAASFLTPYSAVTFSVLPPYLITLITQLVQERQYLKQGSATSVAVPLHHQVYRFLQSARGFYLISVLQGPQWLTALQLYILLLWTFNYGSLMTWMTSMYYWNLQPQDESSKDSKDQ